MNIRKVAMTLAGLVWMASASATSLWTELLVITERHIESQGPDSDAARFIALAGDEAWQARERLFKLTTPYLDSDNPGTVAGALEVLYRLHSYSPSQWVGSLTFEEMNAGYFNAIDRAVLDHVPRAIALNNDAVFDALAHYLGTSKARGSHEALLKLVAVAGDNEQVAICLTWHQDPSDMEVLLPLMLRDTPAAASLPYHFRNSYGQAAVPYLRRAQAAARARFTRESAANELKVLEGARAGQPSNEGL